MYVFTFYILPIIKPMLKTPKFVAPSKNLKIMKTVTLGTQGTATLAANIRINDITYTGLLPILQNKRDDYTLSLAEYVIKI